MRLYFPVGPNTPEEGHYTQVLKGLLRVYFDPDNNSNSSSSNATGDDDTYYEDYASESDLAYPLRLEVSWIKRFKKGKSS